MGGKNKNSAESSGKDMSKKGTGDVPKSDTKPKGCKKTPKHWIGVRVEDEDGKLVKDVTVHCQLSDAAFGIDMATAAVGKDGVYKTDKIFEPGQCSFSFPDVYDVEWWPKGGSAPSTFPDEQGVDLDPGDCALSGADKAGFRNYHSVWDCDGNKAIKKDHPNPNQQAAGSSLRGPSKKEKVEKKALDQSWTFVVRTRKPPKLRIVLVDKDGNPLKDKDWESTRAAVKGKTGADGLIEVTSLKLLKLVGDKLKVIMKPATTPPKAAATTPAPVADPPPYPPAIVAAEFKDKMPEADYKERAVTWDLKIGGLEAFDVHEGALARLANLGFGCAVDLGGKATADGEAGAIKAYQKLYSQSGTTWDALKDDIRDRHDNQ